MEELNRFIKEQNNSGQYDKAMEEIMLGCKQSHWIWFIFPQIKGLGRSYYAQKFAIQSVAEAKAYYFHPVLGKRLKLATKTILLHKDKKIISVMNSQIDVLKLKSCMTLFEAVTGDILFKEVLDIFYEGEKCRRTLTIVSGP